MVEVVLPVGNMFRAQLMRVTAQEVRSEGAKDTRQWRVLWLPRIRFLIEPLHPRADVRRLVECVVKNRIGRDNPRGAQDNG